MQGLKYNVIDLFAVCSKFMDRFGVSAHNVFKKPITIMKYRAFHNVLRDYKYL